MGKVHPGPGNPNWRGGRSMSSHGYALIRVDADHHLTMRHGYAFEHRVVAEQKIGRLLLPHEHVHHVDGDKANNHPSNLLVCDAAEHGLLHRASASRDRRRKPGEENREVDCACGCGARLLRYDATGRPRLYLSGHNPQPPRQKRSAKSRLYLYPKPPPKQNGMICCACGCGSEFMKYDRNGRARRFVSGHNPQKNRFDRMSVIEQEAMNGRE